MMQAFTDPRVRAAFRGGMAMWGRNRRRRADAGRWYFGRRLGIAPNIQPVVIANPNRQRRPRASTSGSLMSVRQTSQPVARSGRVRTNPAPSTYRATGVDWLTDVAAVTDPVNGIWLESYTINPAEPSSFPRLANIAVQYQKYTVVGLSLVYTPSCSTQQKGSMYIAPLRDPTQSIPLRPQGMQGLSGCVRTAVRDPCVISISKSQLSSAFNGFYVGAPNGTAPADDDITKSCGRIVVMLDGVAKTDGVVGTLSVRYNFILSDPKVTASGASLAGQYKFAAVDPGKVPANDSDAIVGKPPLVPLDGETFAKRHLSPILCRVAYTNVGPTPAEPVLQVDGTTVPSLFYTEYGTDQFLAEYWIPEGRSIVTLDTNGQQWTLCTVDCWSTSETYDPQW